MGSKTTMQLWKHHMYQWMETYGSGLGTMDVQLQAKKSNPTKYQIP